jgi:hypothetical protein
MMNTAKGDLSASCASCWSFCYLFLSSFFTEALPALKDIVSDGNANRIIVPGL